jgi:hypothetical protein
MKIAFCIRGHLRDGLTDNRLLNYISLLSKSHEVDLFLHSWSESEAKSSYRTLDQSKRFDVKPEHLEDYFHGCAVKKIIIDDDTHMQLHGNLVGLLPGNKCPVVAWKRMWAGKHALMSHVLNHEGDYDRAVNTRYDMFTTPVCYTPTKNLLKLTEESAVLSIKYPKYYRLLKGVDNYYAGSVKTLHSICDDFHHNLDHIILNTPVRGFHEEIFHKRLVELGYCV